MKILFCILGLIQISISMLLAYQYDDMLFTADVDTEVLDDLLKHPLNINNCSVEDLLVLPGITLQSAKNVVNYRKKIRSYNNIEQLKKVDGINEMVFSQIKPYLTVIRPIKISGDIRLRWEPDKYLYNRSMFWVNDKYHLGWIARKKIDKSLDADSTSELNYENFYKFCLAKYWVQFQDVLWTDKIVLGDYKLQYNQGLIFYYPMNETIRPELVKPKGIQVDKETNPNVNYHGLAFEKKVGALDFALFYSDKKYDAVLNNDGTVKTNLDELQSDYGYVMSEDDLKRYRKLNEKLVGGKINFSAGNWLQLGMTGYDAQYLPLINPPEKYSDDKFMFRGNRNTVYGFNLNLNLDKFSLVSEYAKSKDYGQAWLVQPMYNFAEVSLFLNIHKYDKDYYNFHSSAISEDFAEDYNEEGVIAGVKHNSKKVAAQLQVHFYRHPEPGWQGPVFGKYYGNINPKNTQKLFAELNYKFSPDWEIYYKEQDITETNIFKISSNPTILNDLPCYTGTHRLQITWNKKKFTVSARIENKSGFVSSQTEGTSNKTDFNRWYQGYVFYLDGEYRLNSNFSIQNRIIYFDGPPVYIYLSEFEPYWYASYMSNLFMPQGTGIRYYATLKYKIAKLVQIWVKYEHTKYINDDPENAVKTQIDIRW